MDGLRVAIVAFLWLVAPGCASAPQSLSCAPPPDLESWPSDPTALMPGQPDAGAAFSPAPHAAFPMVPPATPVRVLSSLRLVSVVTVGDPLQQTLFAFGDALVTSDWLAQIAKEYGAATQGVSIHVTGPPLSGNLTTADMRSYVLAAVSNAPAPAGLGLDPRPDGQTLYLLHLPAGVNVIRGGEVNCNCNLLGGAHTSLGSQGDAIAYVQRCTLSDNDYMTRVASHEVAEAITDPIPSLGFSIPESNPPWLGSPWAAGGDNEVGDLCSGTRITLNGWTYQRIWSNAAAAVGGDPCVPAMEPPYFNVSVDPQWVQVPAGGIMDVPVTAWATGPRPDWYVYPLVSPLSAGFRARISSPKQQVLDGTTYNAVNNGDSATLTVTAPQAPSGTHAVVSVWSRSADGVDGVHLSLVGVYIP